ncbi:Uncharacterised protein [Serratia quinivorans]|nr:Uncharacterised protein [Serratia quinivorans]
MIKPEYKETLNETQLNFLSLMCEMSGMSREQFTTYLLKREIMQFAEFYERRNTNVTVNPEIED